MSAQKESKTSGFGGFINKFISALSPTSWTVRKRKRDNNSVDAGSSPQKQRTDSYKPLPESHPYPKQLDQPSILQNSQVLNDKTNEPVKGDEYRIKEQFKRIKEATLDRDRLPDLNPQQSAPSEKPGPAQRQQQNVIEQPEYQNPFLQTSAVPASKPHTSYPESTVKPTQLEQIFNQASPYFKPPGITSMAARSVHGIPMHHARHIQPAPSWATQGLGLLGTSQRHVQVN